MEIAPSNSILCEMDAGSVGPVTNVGLANAQVVSFGGARHLPI